MSIHLITHLLTVPLIKVAFIFQNFMVKEGLAWVDDQGKGERQFWFPSFFPYLKTSGNNS